GPLVMVEIIGSTIGNTIQLLNYTITQTALLPVLLPALAATTALAPVGVVGGGVGADADAYPSSRTAACPAADAGWPTFGVHARLRVHGRRLGHGCPSRGGEQNPQEGGLQAGRRRS
ncbi:hypothetical protein, partial [Mycolicibacterium fortuitum]|uniref:hypothetical protein n=1 Tax=Mycolicibacterium fortuitum TaxID=1766 RepID=UPI000B09F66F